MLRSMYSGISGLRNFQTKLDVIGNNIANVNTYGFKKGRTIFKDLISQTVAGASAPGETRGGVNPKQVGLGSQIAAIDTFIQVVQHSYWKYIRSCNCRRWFFPSGQMTGIQREILIMRQYTRAGNFYMD